MRRSQELSTMFAARNRDYWAAKLLGRDWRYDLAVGSVRPPMRRFRRDRVLLPIPLGLVRELERVAAAEHCSVSLLWVVALHMTLRRHSTQPSGVLGVVLAGTQETGATVPQILPLTSNASLQDAARDFLIEAKRELSDALLHRDLPFESLVELVSAEPAPLQVSVTALGMPGPDGAVLQEDDLFEVEDVLVGCDLDLRLVRNAAGQHELAANFDPDVLDEPAVLSFMHCWQRAATAVTATSDLALDQIVLIDHPQTEPGAASSPLLAAWAGERRAIPELGVHGLFRLQAQRTPDAVAVQSAAESLTYRELDQLSMAVAHGLRTRGVGPGQRVIVRLERSVTMVGVLLGILRAGAAYVPVDPGYPAARVAYIVDDAAASFLIGDVQGERNAIPSATVQDLVHASVGDPALPESGHGDLAYVIYTSGSTGRPKGVRVGHRAAVNLLLAMAERVALTPSDVWLAVTTIAFDISFAELFVPLVVGARTWVAARDEVSDPYALAQRIAELEPRVLQATPQTWRLLLAAGFTGHPDLIAICGGEALPAALAQDIRSRVQRLANVYGPTEATVWVTWQELTEDGAVALGKPLPNVVLRVLDSNLRALPVGVPGELWIGGACLAEGYHGRDDLTQQRFVSDPFSDEPGARLYRTGDLVRSRADGALFWLGRLDEQIKLRGFRIELGEVESTLLRLPNVKQAASALKEIAAGETRLVAYLVFTSPPEAGWEASARKALRLTLPEYMIPASFVQLDDLPRTDNGKLDRRALPLPVQADEPADGRTEERANTNVHARVAEIWQEVLHVKHVRPHDNFFDLGGHSLTLVQVQQRLERAFGRAIARIELFRNPTVDSLARLLIGQGAVDADDSLSERRLRARLRARSGSLGSDIAVIGMSVRVPGAATLAEFWNNLRQGVEARTEFSEAELRAAGISPRLLADPRYVRAGFVLDDIEHFDAELFGFTPREAELLDPQQRIFLETAWQALEDAGIDLRREGAGIGVYAGVDASGYGSTNLAAQAEAVGPAGAFQVRISNDKDYLPTRLSYKLNLLGPSVNVQTACSTSLVAVHMACQSLLFGECDTALAGGVCVHVPQKSGYLYQEGMVMSPDGHCRAFDARGGGTVFGSGAGMVVLRRLDDALAAGDRIYAVIKGSAINNDGAHKIGFTAPSVEGQAEVILEAQAMAGISAENVQYVEAHGTATQLGDPIEIAALTQAFRKSTPSVGFCAIGSVKTSIGHLDQAAGIAGFVKASLAVYHAQLPASLHFESPNPEIDFQSSPFYVNTRLRDWPETKRRFAGVSSFGIGGTNAHVILASAPEVVRPAESAVDSSVQAAHVLTLSARSEEALRALAGRYVHWLAENESAADADLCFSASVGRSPLEQRAAWVFTDKGSLRERLREFASSGTSRDGHRGVHRNRRPRIAFLFTGQGSHYADMGRELFEQEPVFRAALLECGSLLRSVLDVPLQELLYGRSVALLEQTAYAQPALFAVEYGLYKLWASWGVRPQAVLGHSLGEYVAAHVAGVFTLEDAIRLVARRGRLMQELCEPGVMARVSCEEGPLRALLAQAKSSLEIASLNGGTQVVLSGRKAELEHFQQHLIGTGVRVEPLSVSHAFHSRLVEPMLDGLRAALAPLKLSTPALPLISNLTGQLAGEEVTTVDYWLQHTRQAVLFEKGFRSLLHGGVDAVLEIGPKPTLLSLARSLADDESLAWLASLRPGRPERAQLLHSLAELYVRGADLDWLALYPADRSHKLPLPTYPFQRKRFWIEARGSLEAGSSLASGGAIAPAGHSLLGNRLRLPGSAETRFEAEFRPDWPAYVDHHRLFAAMVVPGASHIAMFLAAAEEYFGSAGCAIDELLFLRPFVMPENGRRTVQVVMRHSAEAAACEMLTLEPGGNGNDDQAWTVHITARAVRGPEHVPASSIALAELDQAKARCSEYLSGTDFYTNVWIPGMDTGASFRWIDEIWRGEGEALCRTRRPPSVVAVDGPFHAGLVESGFQLLNSCWKFSTPELLKSDYIYVPFSIDSYRFYGRPTTEQLWVHAQILRQNQFDDQGVTADIRMFDDSGRLVIHVRGFEVRKLHRQVVQGMLSKDLSRWIYATKWERLEPRLSSRNEQAQRCSIVLQDASGVGSELARALRAGREPLIRVVPGSSSGWIEPDCYSINLGESEAIANLVSALSQRVPGVELDIVHLWALDTPREVVDPAPIQESLCRGILDLIRALSRAELAVRLSIVTRGAQSADGLAISTGGALQAALGGLAGVLQSEQPELRTRTIDLDPRMDAAGSAQALVKALELDAEPRLAVRAPGVFAARLKRHALGSDRSSGVRPEASYLITGGLGGLGLRLAERLVHEGARRLVLLSRRPPGSVALVAIEKLRTAGAQIVVAECDVSNAEALRACWNASFQAGDLPLRGVFHAAGELRDGVLAGQSWESFRVALQAKVQGAYNLHGLTQDTALDFFVAFSSVSTVLGTGGQGAYAAANASLDALVQARRDAGQAGLSIQWGPFGEVGMAAALDQAQRDRLLARGLTPMSPEDALSLIGPLSRAGIANVMVASVDWGKYLQALGPNSTAPLLKDVAPRTAAQQPSKPQASSATSLRASLPLKPRTEWARLITEHLQAAVATMLGIDALDIDVKRGLLELGLDSLSAIELRSKLQADFGLALSPTFVFDHGNVGASAEYILTRLSREMSVEMDPERSVAQEEREDGDVESELALLEASLLGSG